MQLQMGSECLRLIAFLIVVLDPDPNPMSRAKSLVEYIPITHAAY